MGCHASLKSGDVVIELDFDDLLRVLRRYTRSQQYT